MRRFAQIVFLSAFIASSAVSRAVGGEEPVTADILHGMSSVEISWGRPCSWSWSYDLSESDESLRRILTWPLAALATSEAKEKSRLIGPSPVFVCDVHALSEPGRLAQRILDSRKKIGRRTVLVLELVSEDLQSKFDAARPFSRNPEMVRSLVEAIESPYPLSAYQGLISSSDLLLAGTPEIPKGPAHWDGYWQAIGRIIGKRLHSHTDLVFFFGTRHILGEAHVRGFQYPADAQVVVTGLPSWEIAIRRRLVGVSPPEALRPSENVLFFPVRDPGSVSNVLSAWAKKQPGTLRTEDVEALRAEDPEIAARGLEALRSCTPWERGRYANEVARFIRSPHPGARAAAFSVIEGGHGRYDIPATFADVLVTAISGGSTENLRRCTDLLARTDIFDRRTVARLRELSSQAKSSGRSRDLLSISIALASSLHCTTQDVANYRHCLAHFHAEKGVGPLIVRIGNCGEMAVDLLDELKKLRTSASPAVRYLARRAVKRIEDDVSLIAERMKGR